MLVHRDHLLIFIVNSWGRLVGAKAWCGQGRLILVVRGILRRFRQHVRRLRALIRVALGWLEGETAVIVRLLTVTKQIIFSSVLDWEIYRRPGILKGWRLVSLMWGLIVKLRRLPIVFLWWLIVKLSRLYILAFECWRLLPLWWLLLPLLLLWFLLPPILSTNIFTARFK